MAGKKGMTKHSLEFRESVLQEKERGITYKELSIKYRIDIRTLKRWGQWKRENGVPKQVTGKKHTGRPRKAVSMERKLNDLRWRMNC